MAKQKVLVDVHLHAGVVSVLELGTDPEGNPAIQDGVRFYELGELHEFTWKEQNPRRNAGVMMTKHLWKWHSYSSNVVGEQTTKAKALDALLAAHDFQGVSVDATIPDLLEGL
jgi:hypothetical protein